MSNIEENKKEKNISVIIQDFDNNIEEQNIKKEKEEKQNGVKKKKEWIQLQGNKINSSIKSSGGSSTSSSREGGITKQSSWSNRLVHTLSNRNRGEINNNGENNNLNNEQKGNNNNNLNNNNNDEWEDEGADNCIFGHQIRFTIMVISTLCLSSILSNILTFNFTYICMAGVRPNNFSEILNNNNNISNITTTTNSNYDPDLDYSSAERTALFMAVAVGALLTVFPLTILLGKFGSRIVFGCLGYMSALSTLLIPIAAVTGFPYILTMRIVQGAAFSACLPVMGSITSHWSTIKQNGIFIAILSSFLQIAPLFTMPISGELCTSSIGWPSVYYLHGLVSILLFTIFMLYHRNYPHDHPMVSRTELVKVMFNKGGSIYSGPGKQKKKIQKVPYKAMYSDMAIWAILVASFGNFMGTQLSLQFMPTYINKVLNLPITQTGMASAVSPLIMFFIKLIAGQSSDKIKFINDLTKLKIYNTLSLSAMGILFCVLAILDPKKSPTICLIVLIASTCILGFNSGGFFKSSQIVSKQHSHFTLANISFLNCVCMLIVPLLNEIIAPDNDPNDWATVLFIHGIILNLSNAFFCIFASAKPASWTLDTFNGKNKRIALAIEQRRKKKENEIKGEKRGRWNNKKGIITPIDSTNNKRLNNTIRIKSLDLPTKALIISNKTIVLHVPNFLIHPKFLLIQLHYTFI
ncbi:hypothetical protein Mgra_00005498 [Meloidogyne graminicola]|uniref:MFS domain-containing protein n=1 Tax=Meloidogyne graminicola TaxID=189291 RepID=A0A8S9ZNG4_9BILA|nr:hypothetical protein Mgra_00005498 [Meloidogyne graminicola]